MPLCIIDWTILLVLAWMARHHKKKHCNKGETECPWCEENE